MLSLDELLVELEYNQSPHYYQNESAFEPETAHLFRAAREAGVDGAYVFETSPKSEHHILPARPAVFVADTQTEDRQEAEKQARELHRSLWNLASVPFLIVRLPHQIRIYNGFNYSQESEEEGLLGQEIRLIQLRDLLSDFTANAIDSGRIWKSKYAQKLHPNQRVDERLLTNLEQLGQVLKKDGLYRGTAHALIGKYVYISYLRSRGILTDTWLTQQQIEAEDVFTRHATVASLRKLVEALEKRFNGHIFPIDFEQAHTLKDRHVSWVASIFSGNKIIESAPHTIHQLHLPFQAYDFRYIPVETLSAIYEQFIDDRKEKGAIYTPEFLADYLLSEIEWAKSLEKGMKILDPACGSGVFLVLAYRRLIEKEMARLGKRLQAHELRTILLDSIYGVERERDACYVTEFSLILTLLHYVEVRELERITFKFPVLHNQRIFEADFFDLKGEDSKAKLWQQAAQFDWIVGNPPWTELKPKTKGEAFARAWMSDSENKSQYPIGGNRVAEAFSWLVTDLLAEDGMVAFVLPATSLFNLESKKYRQHFFSKHEVLRITNFANLRDILFGKGKSGVLPATTMVYRPADETQVKADIIHYGPFFINQEPNGNRDKPWTITINENEIQLISPDEAEEGETSLWKLALWGSHRDKHTLKRLRYLFPNTLEEFCEQHGWGIKQPRQGAEFCNDSTKPRANIKGKKRFSTKRFNRIKPSYRFSIPHESVLEELEKDTFIRRGEDTLKITTPAPHIILSKGWQNFAIYSHKDFIIPPQQIGIAAPKNNIENEAFLRALTIYLSSSLLAYYLFFQVPEWGVFRQRKSVVIREVRKVPTPDLTLEQAKELENCHIRVVSEEKEQIDLIIKKFKRYVQPKLATHENNEEITAFNLRGKLTRVHREQLDRLVNELQIKLQEKIDEAVCRILQIPEDIAFIVAEFVQTRLLLDKPSALQQLIKKPNQRELLSYARELRDELDGFLMGTAYHRVTINYSSVLAECVIEMTEETGAIPIDESHIQASDLTMTNLLAELSDSLREQVSQWVYIQRGLLLFDGPKIYIYKYPRVIDWTRTQALNDAHGIIAKTLSAWG